MDSRIEFLLRARPDARALRWVERVTGSTVSGVRALRGGVSHATHAVTLNSAAGRDTVVLRRWVRPDWQTTDPDYTAAHEAATLTLLAEAGVAAPRCVGVDADAAECDVPAVLATRVPGAKPSLRTLGLETFITGLARALVPVHGIDGEPARALALPYARYYEIERVPVPAWATRPEVWAHARAIASRPEPAGERCFIHRDYHPGNTLWRDGVLQGIVDWDRGSWGSPAVDVAHMRLNLALDHGRRVAGAFTDAYRRAGGLGLDDLAYWDVVDTLDMVPEIRVGDWPARRRRRLEVHLTDAVNRADGLG